MADGNVDCPAAVTPILKQSDAPNWQVRNLTVQVGAIVVLFAIAYAVMAQNSITIPGDLPYYLAAATSLAKWQGYTDAAGLPIISRGPVFPFLLATSLTLVGFNFWTAFYAIWAMAAATAASLAWLAWRWWGWAAGLTAFLFYVLCPTVLSYSSNHLDEVWTIFLVGALWSTSIVVERGGLGRGLMLGLMLAMGCLTKEVLILLVPLPALVQLGSARPPAWKSALVGYGIGLAGPLVGWLTYVLLHGGTVSAGLLGAVASGASATMMTGGLFWRLPNVGAYIGGTGVPLPLLAVTAAGIPVLALRGGLPEKIVLWALALLSPFLGYVILVGLRPGQLISLVLLEALVLGRLTSLAARWLLRTRTAVAGVLAVVVAVGVSDHRVIQRYLGGSRVAALLRGELRGPETFLFRADGLADLVREVELPPGEPLLVYDTELNCYSCSVAYFQTMGRRHYLPFPFRIATADNLDVSSWLPQADIPRHLDYVRPQFEISSPRHRLWFLDLDVLRRYALGYGVRHLAVVESGNPVLIELLEQSGFRRVSAAHGYSMFAVEGPPDHRTTLAMEDRAAYCDELRRLTPKELETYRAQFPADGLSVQKTIEACSG